MMKNELDFKNTVIEKLNAFAKKEYGEVFKEEDFIDISKIGIMFTEYEDLSELNEMCENEELNYEFTEPLQVQVYLDIKNDPCKIWIEYNSINVYEESYNQEDLLNESLEHIDFGGWTNLDELNIFIEKLQLKNLEEKNSGPEVDKEHDLAEDR